MKSLSLKTVYKNLLQEAILDQSTFLFRLSDVLDQRSTGFGNEKSILFNLLKSIKDTRLKDLQGSKNKKARKKAEIEIHKRLKQFQGISGDPIDLKKMRPLYDSIIQFVSSKKDVDIEHCFLAADYYMNDFYNNADEEEKNLVDNGKIEFSKILKVTKFYQQYFNFKDQLGLFEDSSAKIYEDDRIKVVYPQNPHAFNTFIQKNDMSVDWCTQSPTTWHNYRSRMYVMIILDKVFDEGIISLKVKFNGDIDYVGTCDQYNDHMDEGSVKSILPQEAEDAIKEAVENNKLEEGMASGDFSPSDAIIYLKGLLDANNFSEINTLLITISQADSTGDMLIEVIDNFIKYAEGQNKSEQALNSIVDVVSSLNFDSQDFSIQSIHDTLRDNNVEELFRGLLIKTCLNKRSHVKYFMAFSDLYRNPIYAPRLKRDIRKIKEMTFFALNKNNPINFKKSISSITKNKVIAEILTQDNFFPEFFTTAGFKIYFNEKKEKVIVLRGGALYSFHPMGNMSELFVSNIIEKNYESFANFIQKFNDESEEESRVSFESLDFSLIARFIHHQTQFQKYDINNMGLESIAKNTFEMSESDIEEIKNKIYTDIDLVELLCKNNKILCDALLRHYLSKEYSFIGDDKRNTAIDLNNQNSYQILLYLIKNSVEIIPEQINTPQPPLTLVNAVTYILSLMSKFKVSPNNIDNEVKDKLIQIANREGFIKGFFQERHIPKENLIDFYYEIISNVDFEPQHVGNVTFNTTKTSVVLNSIIDMEFLNSGNIQNDLLEKITSKVITIPAIKRAVANKVVSGKNIKARDLYSLFYLLKYDSLDSNTITKLLIEYIKLLKFGPNEDRIVDFRKLTRYAGNDINQLISSSIAINSEFTSIIGQIIDKDNMNKDALRLIAEIVRKCNETNVVFHKEHLAKAFYNAAEFTKLSVHDRQQLLANFITKSDGEEQNYLNARDRVIVKNCLRDCRYILSSDYDFIMNICEKLDHYSKFQLRSVFPFEERLKDNPANESLIKDYIKLFFS